jgi:hypothetical protein
MAVSTPSRPDLLAYREATTLDFPKLIKELTTILGKKLTAYIGQRHESNRALDGRLRGVQGSR